MFGSFLWKENFFPNCSKWPRAENFVDCLAVEKTLNNFPVVIILSLWKTHKYTTVQLFVKTLNLFSWKSGTILLSVHPKSPYFLARLTDFRYVVLLIKPYNVVLTFGCVDEILKCDHSNESYRAVLSCGAVYYAAQGSFNFWVCGWNPKVSDHWNESY